METDGLSPCPKIDENPIGFIDYCVKNPVDDNEITDILVNNGEKLVRLAKNELTSNLNRLKFEILSNMRNKLDHTYKKYYPGNYTLIKRQGNNANFRLAEDIYHFMFAIVEKQPLKNKQLLAIYKQNTTESYHNKATQGGDDDENDNDEELDQLWTLNRDLEIKVSVLEEDNKRLNTDLIELKRIVEILVKQVNKPTDNTISIINPSHNVEEQNVQTNTYSSVLSKSTETTRNNKRSRNSDIGIEQPTTSKKILYQFDSTTKDSTLTPILTKDTTNKGKNDWQNVSSKKRPNNNLIIGNKERNNNKVNNQNNTYQNRSDLNKSYKKNTLKRNNIIGTGKLITDFKISERKLPIYIGRISNEMGTEDVIKLLNQMKINHSELKLLERKHNFFKSYSFLINAKDKDSILDPSIWPEGIVVNRLITAKRDSKIKENINLINNNNTDKINNSN